MVVVENKEVFIMNNKEKLDQSKNERLGEINISNEGYEMKIIEYKDANHIIIKFQDKHNAKVSTKYSHFKNGQVKNPYHPSACGIAYYGQGKYKSRGEDGKKTKAYITWIHMIKRCYDPYFINKNLTYIDCYVCDEWLNFQNFAEWFYKHYYEVSNEIMQLDKDILIKGNKIYSPKTCLIVPQRINDLFVKQQRKRGEYPIGVNPNKINNCLVVQCQTLEKSEYLGCFPLDKPFQAFIAYKNYKENYIKQVADEYKDLIPQKLYEALYRYKVEIND